MRSKARKPCKFLDTETQEEKEDGTIITKFDDDDDVDVPTKEDEEFVTSNDESDQYESDCSKVHESEKELDEDDYVLLADNKANQKKRVRIKKTIKSSGSEDSDSSHENDVNDDNFIDDSEFDQDQLKTILDMLSPVPTRKSIKSRETFPTSTVQRRINSIGRLPAQSLKSIGEWVNPEMKKHVPQSSSNWNFLREAPAKTSKQSADTSKSLSGIVKTADGDYLMGKNGKRHKLTNGNVCLSSKPT